MTATLDMFRERGLALADERRRERDGLSVEQDAERLSGRLIEFVKAAWPVVWPNQSFAQGWHTDVICAHLEAVTAGEIRRLQVWVPPGSTKSTTVSIMWPAWEWTRDPWRRHLTASYAQNLADDFATKARDLIKSGWYQQLWPAVQIRRDQDLKRSYANTAGGSRFATSPGGSGTGRHAHTIIIDDPLNAQEIASEAALAAVREWHDGTLSTRFADPKTGCEVIIMQRLAEEDLAGHVLELRDDWTVLCLPERYEMHHQFAWRAPRVHAAAARRLPAGLSDGDPRDPDTPPLVVDDEPVEKGDGALLIPKRVGPVENAARAADLGSHRAAGQLQQRPAAREGAILKRAAWNFFPARHLEDAELHYLPKFSGLVQSWDTAFKDRTSSDFVVGGLWGQRGADLYLLALRRDRMGLSATKQAMRDMTALAEARWPGLPHRILIEKSANGVEIIEELKREIRGVTPVVASVSKVARAEAAEPALEAGNIFLPGASAPESPSGYNEALTPDFAQGLVEECAVFPNGAHDDQVDMFTQAVNWARGRMSGPARVARSRRQLDPVRSWSVHRGDVGAGLL